MTSSMTIDDADFNKAMQSLARAVDNPEKGLNKIFLNVVKPGATKHFNTKGQHWGTAWKERGDKIKAVRRWQGFHADADKTLIASGRLRDDWVITGKGGSFKKGAIMGAIVNYSDKQHFGIGSGKPVTFHKKGTTGGKSWTTTFPEIHARPIIPIHGFNTNEVDNMTIIMRDELQEAFDKR